VRGEARAALRKSGRRGGKRQRPAEELERGRRRESSLTWSLEAGTWDSLASAAVPLLCRSSILAAGEPFPFREFFIKNTFSSI